jgi:divalent metal cation (Fe/Co/Zn/Cd) transporter
MLPSQVPDSDLTRTQQVIRALRLVSVSVAFGLVSGSVSVITGLGAHSLGVFAVGLGVFADVTGSATLIWRFRAERRQPGHSAAHERRAAIIVAIALAVVAVVLTVESITALASGSRPGTSSVTLIAAGVSLAVLTPLAYAKRRLGRQMSSLALQGDGALSGIGAATSLLALAALVLNDAFGWWWADRIAALIVAVVAAAEAWHTAPHRRTTPQPDGCPRGGNRHLCRMVHGSWRGSGPGTAR